MNAPAIIEVFCEGPPGARHERRVLRRYARQEADPPQWWPMPSHAALRQETAHGPFAPARWSRIHRRIGFRCRDCRVDLKHTLDRDYDRDYPPLSAVLEELRANGIAQVPVRNLDTVVAWK
ncbi:hypothetical protein [Mycobacterium sp. URHD0025]|uniref:hypothetical protein n=1 Tax=Mycobacterium sp. URHD0025 TaxID=1298864 RepID=UPI0012DD6219|nr:hypothetical protein [Mycobacterium sp. URHD0025]